MTAVETPEDDADASLEQHLVAAGAGDSAAFEAVYRGTAARVLGLTMRVVSDRAEAEEVAREAYIEAWRQASGFDPERSAAMPWLLGIAHERAVAHVRQRPVSPANGIGADPRSEAASAVHLDAQVGRTDEHGVRAALRSLSGAQRQAILLAYFDGLTLEQVAMRVDVPLGTAATRMRSGMLRLRAALGDGAPSAHQVG